MKPNQSIIAGSAVSPQLIMARNVLTGEEKSDQPAESDVLLNERLSLHRDLNAHALLPRSYFCP